MGFWLFDSGGVADFEMNILVVEDEIFLHQFYIDVLSGFEEDIKTIPARSGEDALAIIEQTQIDGVFIDIELPGMNGFALANKIRRIEKYHFLPIVFATGTDCDTPETYKKYRNIDYVIKPFSRDTFSKIAARFIEDVKAFKSFVPEKEGRELYFRHDAGAACIKFVDILYALTAPNRKIRLVTREGVYYKSNISFSNFLILIGDEMFVQCNKSCAVNVLNISEIRTPAYTSYKTWDILFKDAPSHVCELSLKYRKNIESLFMGTEE